MADTMMTVERCLWEGKISIKQSFLAVNSVRVMLLSAKINGLLEEAVMKRTIEVVTAIVTLIESEEYDKDISVQYYRHCGDIVYLFLN